jgi:hypothetical protein
VQNLQEGKDRFLDAFLVAPLNGFTKTNALGDFLVPVGVLELVVEGLGEVIRDESIAAGQELATVLGISQAGM